MSDTVLGVDAGTVATGYGVVARGRGGAFSLLECGVIRTTRGADLARKVTEVFEGLGEVIDRHKPAVVAVEGVFYGRNARTAVALGHVRGAVLVAASLRGAVVAEYSPTEVKNAVVGTGSATKEQVQFMVQRLLKLQSPPQPEDAADAVAVALCHCFSDGLRRRLAGGIGRQAPLIGRARKGPTAGGGAP